MTDKTIKCTACGAPTEITQLPEQYTVVLRSVLDDALSQIEATWVDGSGDPPDPACADCGVDLTYDAETRTYSPLLIRGTIHATGKHRSDCRYTRVRTLLKDALTPRQIPNPPAHKKNCRARATDQSGITWAIVEKDCDCGLTAPEKLKT